MEMEKLVIQATMTQQSAPEQNISNICNFAGLKWQQQLLLRFSVAATTLLVGLYPVECDLISNNYEFILYGQLCICT